MNHKLDESVKRSKIFRVRLTKQEHDALKEMADREGVSMSKLIQNFIYEKYKNPGQKHF